MDVPLSALKGIGEVRRASLDKAGIRTVRELLSMLPREYRDLTDVRPLAALKTGEPAAVRARVIGGVTSFRKGALAIVRVRLADESGEAQAVWYNQPWLVKQLVPRPRALALRRGRVARRESAADLPVDRVGRGHPRGLPLAARRAGQGA